MEIKKFAGISPSDIEAIDRTFATIEPQPIACCNWPDKFPYKPDVRFRMFHTSDYLMIRFEVEELHTAALVTHDNGEVWTDSCVEFFISPAGNDTYYNFETTCTGRMLLAYHKNGQPEVRAEKQALDSVIRYTALPYGAMFTEDSYPVADDELERWSLTLAIPPQALFHHTLTSWDGLTPSVNLYKCGDNLSVPHFLSWAPIIWHKPNFHLPSFFRPVKLLSD